MKSYELKQQIKAKEQEIAAKRETSTGLANILETRDLSDDEDKSFRDSIADIAQLQSDIADLQSRVSKLEDIEASEGNLDDPDQAEDDAGRSRNVPAIQTRSRISLETRDNGGNYLASREYKQAWINHLQTGESVRTNAASFLAGTSAAGGYAIAPIQVANKILTNIANAAPISELVTKYNVNNAAAFRVPKLSVDPALPSFGTEGQCLSPDLSGAFSNIDLTPTLMAELVTVSMTMVRLGGQAFVDFVTNRLSYLYTRAIESQIMVGNYSSGNFLGAFVANAAGIPTSQDVVTAGAGALTGDDLINAVAALNPTLLNSSTLGWAMHPTTLAVVRKLKDLQGRYLLEPGLANGTPATILGIPVYQSFYCPAYSSTSGSYVAVVGDWQYYWTAEYNDSFEIQRLNERFADCSLIGILGRRWIAGAPVMAQGFSRLKIQ